MKILKKEYKDKKGITLIALVITVVVMLILAGVVIAAVVNADGLFSKIRDAAEAYENEADRENEILTNLIEKVDYYLGEGGSGDVETPEDDEPVDDNPIVKPTATIGTIVTENQTFDGRLESEYNNPIIPKGFAPVNENGAEWGTAEGYKYGLVITDAVDGSGISTGNEFVWVPVDGTTVTFARQDWRNSEGELLTWPENTTIGTDTDTQYTETLPTEITASVTNNGGFYIARYEAGKLQDGTLATDGSIKPVSKQGASAWNNIPWGATNDDENPGNGAVTVARSMYLVGDANYGVASTLIYGAQWDTALRFIGAYNTEEAGYDTYATNSTGMGNHHGTGEGDPTDAEPATSGFSDTFRQKNIYDMAGNVWEWTMEVYSTNCVHRGGAYNSSGPAYPASFRNSDGATYSHPGRGFRVTLYIK